MLLREFETSRKATMEVPGLSNQQVSSSQSKSLPITREHQSLPSDSSNTNQHLIPLRQIYLTTYGELHHVHSHLEFISSEIVSLWKFELDRLAIVIVKVLLWGLFCELFLRVEKILFWEYWCWRFFSKKPACLRFLKNYLYDFDQTWPVAS